MLWIFSTRVLIENTIYYAAGAFALWKGGRAERVVAAALLIENTISFFAADVRYMEAPRYMPLALDVLVLAAILYVVFSTDRRWTLLASALQILSMLTFVTRILDPSILSWTYVTVDIGISFALMAAVVYGAVTSRLRPPSLR
jgi:hypothetical protein